MPRTLPWLVGGGNDERVKKEPGSHRKRIKSEAPSDNDYKAKTKSATPDTPKRRDFLRSCTQLTGVVKLVVSALLTSAIHTQLEAPPVLRSESLHPKSS